jgi:putative nucleotidyltransferase with HDIG domain
LLHQMAQGTAKLFAPARVHLTVIKAGRPSPLAITESSGLQPDEPATLAISLPVMLDGEVFGQFEVSLGESGRLLHPDEERILRSMVHLIGSALGTASLASGSRQAMEAVEQAYMGTLEALTKALEMRDHETEGHSRRVVQYTVSLAQKLGLPEAELVPLMRGALLHDIGKIGIPDSILKKQGPLTEAEWQVMRHHPVIGHEMLQGIEFLYRSTPIILHHHERIDGSGYPLGLAGEAIPLGARIFAVADAYDAMTSDRPYRPRRTHEAAVIEIRAHAYTQFDARVVEALVELPVDELARIRSHTLEAIR